MRIEIGLVALALVSGATNVRSQVFEPGEEPRTVRTEGFWENWFVQPVTGHNWPRVANDRHHWYDVVAGAAVGYGAAELSWYLSDKLLGPSSKVAVATTGQTVDVTYTF